MVAEEVIVTLLYVWMEKDTGRIDRLTQPSQMHSSHRHQ